MIRVEVLSSNDVRRYEYDIMNNKIYSAEAEARNLPQVASARKQGEGADLIRAPDGANRIGFIYEYSSIRTEYDVFLGAANRPN